MIKEKKGAILIISGPSGCGKSTLAAYVYAMLKDDGIDGELVTEYIREHVNKHKRVPSITFQSIVYERQMEKEKNGEHNHFA